jgi:hypothetical protein
MKTKRGEVRRTALAFVLVELDSCAWLDGELVVDHLLLAVDEAEERTKGGKHALADVVAARTHQDHKVESEWGKTNRGNLDASRTTTSKPSRARQAAV